jgi:phosphatidylglycerophosphate synthase
MARFRALCGPCATGETNVMMQMCGSTMMVAGILATILGLGLLANLIVLVWVAIGRLRRAPHSEASR